MLRRPTDKSDFPETMKLGHNELSLMNYTKNGLFECVPQIFRFSLLRTVYLNEDLRRHSLAVTGNSYHH